MTKINDKNCPHALTESKILPPEAIAPFAHCQIRLCLTPALFGQPERYIWTRYLFTACKTIENASGFITIFFFFMFMLFTRQRTRRRNNTKTILTITIFQIPLLRFDWHVRVTLLTRAVLYLVPGDFVTFSDNCRFFFSQFGPPEDNTQR